MAENEPTGPATSSSSGFDIATPVGLGLAAFSLLGAFLMDKLELGRPPEGFLGPFGGLINMPAMLIVMGGTFAAALISFPLASVLKLPKLFIKTTAGAMEPGPE